MKIESGQPPLPLINRINVMYNLSISGRSSRSTLMQMNFSFMIFAVSSSSKDSFSITWHQWHVEYPIDRNINLFSFFAKASASSPQGYQLTGLWACCNKYGDFSLANRLTWLLCCVDENSEDDAIVLERNLEQKIIKCCHYRHDSFSIIKNISGARQKRNRGKKEENGPVLHSRMITTTNKKKKSYQFLCFSLRRNSELAAVESHRQLFCANLGESHDNAQFL